MAQQGAVLQNYNNELVKSIEELTRRRAQLNDQIKTETLEKSKLEAEKNKIEEKLSTVECSLKKKLTDRAEYDLNTSVVSSLTISTRQYSIVLNPEM